MSNTVSSALFRGVNLKQKTLTREVELIRKSLQVAMKTEDPTQPGQPIGKARAAIYAFYDFDGEPIYVGQTADQVQGRVGRHLTGMRSDSVAKFVLDPFEVYLVAVWPLPAIAALPSRERKAQLNKYEFAVHAMLTSESRFQAVLNEGNIPPQDEVHDLPEPVAMIIIPDEIFPERAHPDVRIARRAQTVSLLARHISERKVSKGLRRTLLVQSERLSDLASRRQAAMAGEPDPAEAAVADDNRMN